MKLLRIHIISAESCGGLLDGFNILLRSELKQQGDAFTPLCLIGPNGAGKSQLLQVIAEIFQLAWHECSPTEERIASNPKLQFELEYLVSSATGNEVFRIRLARRGNGSRVPLTLEKAGEAGEWLSCNLSDPASKELLPSKIVAYTSGGNETLSLPFLVSRSGYAKDVTEEAFKRRGDSGEVPDTRLMLIDYGTHLEVLAANLLLGGPDIRKALLKIAPVEDLHSFRCIIQLAHNRVPKIKVPGSNRKGIQITDELESYLDFMARCATCHTYDEETETYIFDYFVDDAVRFGFRTFWSDTLKLYSSFHKFSMLNDLAIPRQTRIRFMRETKTRRFASRLAEPQDEEKVFRFERVCFSSRKQGKPVDYVSLSDGEHQLAQILGTMAMTSFSNVLYLLDEPESHFNPKWRVAFISQLLELPTSGGARKSGGPAARQDCLMTTHAPFVPSDMPKESVLIFQKNPDGKIEARTPEIETFGTTFDTILEECFGISPPISKVSRDRIDSLMKSNDSSEIRSGMEKLGSSVEKAFLADRAAQLDANKK